MKIRSLLGLCYVGRHVTGNAFALLKFAFDTDRGVHFLIGPSVSIPSQAMEKDGLSIVLDQLRNIPVLNPQNLSDTEKIPDKEFLKLKRTHVLVSVELLKNGIEEMKLLPLHAGRGWQFDVRAEEVQVFKLPETNGEFMQHLNEALELAS